MRLFTETNGQLLSLIISLIIVTIYLFKCNYKPNILQILYLSIPFLINIFINVVLLGWMFKYIHNFMELILSNLTMENILLIILDIFICLVLFFVYLISIIFLFGILQSIFINYDEED